jgi:hypothetical protein
MKRRSMHAAVKYSSIAQTGRFGGNLSERSSTSPRRRLMANATLKTLKQLGPRYGSIPSSTLGQLPVGRNAEECCFR